MRKFIGKSAEDIRNTVNTLNVCRNRRDDDIAVFGNRGIGWKSKIEIARDTIAADILKKRIAVMKLDEL